MDSRWADLSHLPSGQARTPKFGSPQDFLSSAPLSPLEDRPAEAGVGQREGTAAPPYLIHTVTPRDTLEGLSLKYGVSVPELKLANDLVTSNLSVVATLRIPVAGRIRGGGGEGDGTPAALLRAFRTRNSIPEAEARYYLESADWKAAAAQAEYEKDSAFAARNAARESAAEAAAGSRGRTLSGGLDIAALGRTASALTSGLASGFTSSSRTVKGMVAGGLVPALGVGRGKDSEEEEGGSQHEAGPLLGKGEGGSMRKRR